MTDDLEQQLEDATATPQQFEEDGVKAVARPLKDLIAADQYIRNRRATRSSRSGLRLTHISPPGTV